MPPSSNSLSSKILGWLCMMMIVQLTTRAQAQAPCYFNFNEEQGFPSTEVFGIAEDERGLIWLGSDRGLFTFDNNQFKPFSSPHYNAGNSILKFYHTDDKKLLLSSLNKSFYLLQNGKLNAPSWYDTYEKKYKKQGGGDLSYDKKGNILMASWGNAYDLIYYRKSTNTLISLKRDDLIEIPIANLDSKLIFFEVGENHRWLTTRKTSEKYGYELPMSELVQLDSNSFGFCKFSTTKLESTCGLIFGNEYKELATIPFRCYRSIVDHNGYLWFMGDEGLIRFKDPMHSNQYDHFLKGIRILGFMMDRENNYWASTQSKGIYRIPNFDLLEPTAEILQSLTNVHSIARLDSLLVIQNIQSGITVLYPSGRYLQLPPLEEDFSTWTNSLFADTANNSLSFFNLFPDQTTQLRQFLGPEFKVEPAVIILNDQYFLNFSGNEVEIHSKEQPSKLIYVYPDEDFPSRPLNFVKDELGRQWIGCLNGVLRISGTNYKQVENFAERFPELKCRISEISIVSGTKNQFWVSSIDNGLFFVNGDTCIQFNHSDGLSSNVIQCLLPENDSVMWAGTVNGLNRINYHLKEGEFSLTSIEPFGKDDGLLDNRINSMEWWKGNILLASRKGIVAVNPSNLQPNTIAPKIFLSEISTDSHNLFVDEAGVLNSDNRKILFRYQAISFHRSFVQNFFRYRLQKEGEDTASWNLTNELSVQFTNLSHGNYSFILQAQNNHQCWSKQPAVYQFTVLPHFTETWWFTVLLVLIGGIIIGGILFTWLYITRRDFNYKLRLRDSELTLLRTQMSPHFVFNVLNSLQQFIFANDPVSANYYLTKLSRLMRKSLDFSKVAYIPLSEEISFLDNYLQLEQSRFDDQFDLVFTVDENLTATADKILVPPMMVQPLLENAIKHGISGLDYRGKLTVNVLLKETSLCFEVQDNGLGLAEESSTENYKQQRAHAISILKDRLILLNSLEFAPKATLSITNQNDPSKGQTGLLVELLLPLIPVHYLEETQSQPDLPYAHRTNH